jgi:hypothetical protein
MGAILPYFPAWMVKNILKTEVALRKKGRHRNGACFTFCALRLHFSAAGLPFGTENGIIYGK